MSNELTICGEWVQDERERAREIRVRWRWDDNHWWSYPPRFEFLQYEQSFYRGQRSKKCPSIVRNDKSNNMHFGCSTNQKLQQLIWNEFFRYHKHIIDGYVVLLLLLLGTARSMFTIFGDISVVEWMTNGRDAVKQLQTTKNRWHLWSECVCTYRTIAVERI